MEPVPDPVRPGPPTCCRVSGHFGGRLFLGHPRDHRRHLARHGPTVSAEAGAGGPARCFVEFFRAVPVLMMMLFAYYLFLFGFQISGDDLHLGGHRAHVLQRVGDRGARPRRGRVAAQGSAGGGPGHRDDPVPDAGHRAVAAGDHRDAAVDVSQLVVILKDSALGYWINTPNCSRRAKSSATYQANTIPALIVAAAIYIVINYVLSRLASVVEYRLKTRSKGGAPLPADTVTGPDAAVGVNTAAV